MISITHTLRQTCKGALVLGLALTVSQVAYGQRTTLRPINNQLGQVGTPGPNNRTLSNYYAFSAVPGNPLSQNNALNNQINNYYQNQSNNQLNTVTGIVGNNLSPLVPQGGYGGYGGYGGGYGSPYGGGYGGYGGGGYGGGYGSPYSGG